MIEVALPGARVVFTDREQGDVREASGLTAVGALSGRPLARGSQVHGTFVHRVSGTLEPVEADGQATARHDVAVMVAVADCLPVAVAGPGGVAMLHAGWRGLAGGVLEEGVRALRDVGAAGLLSAVIGPGARGCCYEVGDEVRAMFGETGSRIDLATIAARRLAAAGVEQIEDVARCTICDARYFSHRREGEAAGRQAGVAWRA
ncbi:MAG: polyphenol oxidase family protein [Solirubrobacteraceae bacterium]